MTSINGEVAALLREYAELLGLTGGDLFRARSYEKAAKAVAGYPDDLGTLPERVLTKVPSVGSSVAAKIAEYRRTGTIKAVDDLRAVVPTGALLLAKVPGVGPKRALQIAGELGVTSVGELEEAVQGGRLRRVPGFGPKTEERILRGIAVEASDTALRAALRAWNPTPRWTTSGRCSPHTSREQMAAKRSTPPFRGRTWCGWPTSAETCTRIPTSPRHRLPRGDDRGGRGPGV